jgi:tetratricopeptide (TPR) repeat protein
VLEDGLGFCAEVPALFPPLAGDLAVVYALSGRIDRALDLAEQAVQRAERMGRLGRLSLITTHLGEVSLFAGRRAAAARHAQRALDLAVEHSERGNQVYALRLLAVLAAEEKPADVERARETFVRALDLAEQLSMRPLIARCHVGLGQLARNIGDADAAGAHLERARGMLEDMGMSFWLDRLRLDQVGPA